MKSNCIIHTKDIMIITGRSLRYAQQLLAIIRAAMNKLKHEFVTIYEFADYSDIDIEIVKRLCK